MIIRDVSSSVVFVGDGFSPSLFKADRYATLLGEADDQNLVITPVVSQQFFPDSGYRIFITPDRFEITRETVDTIFPDDMADFIHTITHTLQKTDIPTFKALGFNISLTVPQEILGTTGAEYCRKAFLPNAEFTTRMGADKFIANTAKLVFQKSHVRYIIDVEPHFASNGNHLHIKVNAHQDIGPDNSLEDAIAAHEEVKLYLATVPDRILGEPQ